MTQYLTDSNLWLRIAQPDHPMSPVALGAMKTLMDQGETLCLVPQVIAEFWRVATATASQRGGLGWSVGRTWAQVRRLEAAFPLYDDTAAVHRSWKTLVLAQQVTGASVYDARLAAAMLAHGIPRVLTFNHDDFRRYAPWGVTAVDPASV